MVTEEPLFGPWMQDVRIRLIPPDIMAQHRDMAIAAQGRPVSRAAGVAIVVIWVAKLNHQEPQPVGNPMHPNKFDRFDTTRLNNAPRCHARSKRSGLPCKAPAVTGYHVCRVHGARGGAPEGKRNGNYR